MPAIGFQERRLRVSDRVCSGGFVPERSSTCMTGAEHRLDVAAWPTYCPKYFNMRAPKVCSLFSSGRFLGGRPMPERPWRNLVRRVQQGILAPVEWLFAATAGSIPLPGSAGTFLVAPRRHRGDPVALPDGTAVQPGDIVLEIHFWNRRIARRLGQDAQAVTWAFIRDLRTDFEVLARRLAAGDLAPNAQAIYGASPIAGGAVRFGFWVRPLPPGLRSDILSRWQRMLRAIYRPATVQSTLTEDTVEMWMSRQEFIRRFAASTREQRPNRRKPGPPTDLHKGVTL